MNEGKLSRLSIEFAIEIVNYCKWLEKERKEYVLSQQLLRSGTSIGANIHEANYAVSRADFISKMQIAVKEASETEYWLIILNQTGYSCNESPMLQMHLTAIKKMLVASLNTAKNK